MTRKFTPEEWTQLFWAKVDMHGPIPAHKPGLGPCWLWLGQLDKDGYGNFWVARKKIHAYTFLVGPAPKPLVWDHLCFERRCVNPSHLEAVSTRTNILRGNGMPAQNLRRTHCVRGHPFSGANLIIEPKGHRRCRSCSEIRWKESRARIQADPVRRERVKKQMHDYYQRRKLADDDASTNPA